MPLGYRQPHAAIAGVIFGASLFDPMTDSRTRCRNTTQMSDSAYPLNLRGEAGVEPFNLCRKSYNSY
jgi:hypothetical protein